MSEPLLHGCEVATRPLGSMVSIDPESLPLGTNPRFEFHYIDISCATNGRLQVPSTSTSYAQAPSRARRIVKSGDVLMSTVRPNLKAFAYCNIPEGSYIASTGFAVLRAIEGNDPRYILYSILSDDVARQIDSYVVGSNYPAINSSDVKRLQIPDWKLPQQRRIAEILSTVDETIEQTEALIAKYQQIKAGLMHDLFTRGLSPEASAKGDVTWTLRPTRAQAPHLYKESPLGWIPKEWKFGVLDGFSDMHNNLRKPISAEVRETMHGEYPYYGPTGILDYINEFLVEGEFCLIGEDGDHFLKFAEWPMTILVGGRFNVNNHAHILSGRNGATTRWLHTFFLNRDITFHLTRQGAGRFKLNKAALKKLPICVPDPAEQYEVLDRIEAAQSSIKAQNRQLDKLRQQKQGLMQDLLTGRVRVKVGEPAST